MIAAPPLFDRAHLLQKLEEQTTWDVIVIGGGATGLGIAVDAASRGYSTVLFESHDFAKGTSSRSTKLVHGGVRYLAQGNIPLVHSALQERGRLLKNAPHVVRKRAFVIPCYRWSNVVKYLVGLKLYDALAGTLSFGKSMFLKKQTVVAQFPGLHDKGLKGGVQYFDGQFDDARLAINLAQTAIEHGAVVLNYFDVFKLLKKENNLCGVYVCDRETGREYRVQGSVVFNATGVFAPAVHQLDVSSATPFLKQSQGVHLVLPAALFPADSALMIPKTRDGRVLFVIPWYDHLVMGTTDTPVAASLWEPQAQEAEVAFILETLNGFVKQKIKRSDIQSVFVGLRPLVLPQKEVVSTKELSRDHKIFVSASGLITITGGKWTTYRKMAEEAVETAIKNSRLISKKCITKNLKIHGATTALPLGHLAVYGSDSMGILKSWADEPALQKQLHHAFPNTEGEVVWAVQHELARTVEDVLARRLRFLFLNAAAALEAAPRVSQLMRHLLNQTAAWETDQLATFTELAKGYLLQPMQSQTLSETKTN